MAQQKWLQRYYFFMDKTKNIILEIWLKQLKKQLLVAAVN